MCCGVINVQWRIIMRGNFLISDMMKFYGLYSPRVSFVSIAHTNNTVACIFIGISFIRLVNSPPAFILFSLLSYLVSRGVVVID